MQTQHDVVWWARWSLVLSVSKKVTHAFRHCGVGVTGRSRAASAQKQQPLQQKDE
jgi:hypothetical protein